jgi:hypothetical protein
MWVLSHELAEASTDADPGSGWWDEQNGDEVGDSCVGQLGHTYPAKGGGLANVPFEERDFTMQEIWDNQVGGYCSLAAWPDTGRPCAGPSDCASSKTCSPAGTCAAATCSDGVLNGDETDVDCGGSCDRCADGKACLGNGDCEALSCFDGVCNYHCYDGVQDSTETGIDCGGGGCVACPVGSGCVTNSDCLYGACQSDICAPPNCTDGIKDGAESDVDCAGGCPLCAAGQKCTGGYQCQSEECGSNGVCVTCTDGIKDGAETDVDCGGVCPPCGFYQQCTFTQDCGLLLGCIGGYCLVATCTDGIQDGLETGIDCGGPTGCAPCAIDNRCKVAADCQSGECTKGFCTACSDGVQDGFETDVDCGGPACAPCALGQQCLRSIRDCVGGGACVSRVCTAATCTDNIKDGTESDVDCGGTTCTPCANFRQCATGSDCQNKSCLADQCMPPTCTDGIQNGAESDVDCAGGCPLCAAGQKCTGGYQCQSEECGSNGVCVTCTDGIKDGTETDVDCGGVCPACALGQHCVYSQGDCQAPAGCVSGVCSAPTCSDGVQDGNETGIDCGGGTCAPCALDVHCTVGADCQSGECTKKFCTACSDGVKDGFETDVDCGGPACAPCALGQQCLRTVRDCVGGGACVSGVCTVATCSDGIKDGTESAVDCGGNTCAPCAVNKACNANSDCQSDFCLAGQCWPTQCEDGTQDGAETDVDCGGGTCAPCALGEHCADTGRDCAGDGLCLSGTCRAATCSDGVKDGTETGIDCGGSCAPCAVGQPCAGVECQPATCSDGIQNSDETDVDCGGLTCGRCAAGKHCLLGPDCQTGLCAGFTCTN